MPVFWIIICDNYFQTFKSNYYGLKYQKTVYFQRFVPVRQTKYYSQLWGLVMVIDLHLQRYLGEGWKRKKKNYEHLDVLPNHRKVGYFWAILIPKKKFGQKKFEVGRSAMDVHTFINLWWLAVVWKCMFYLKSSPMRALIQFLSVSKYNSK